MVAVVAPSGKFRKAQSAPRLSAKAISAPPWSTAPAVQSSGRQFMVPRTSSFSAACTRTPSSSANGISATSSRIGNSRYAGKLLALEQLERRAASGGDPRDAVGNPRVVHGANRVAAADDGEAVRLGERAGDRECPLGELRPLEDTHRAVPEGRACRRDALREVGTRLWTDVETQPALRQRVERSDLRVGVLGE